jgi:hypothetical protein
MDLLRHVVHSGPPPTRHRIALHFAGDFLDRMTRPAILCVANAFPAGVRHSVSPEVGLECESYGVRWAFVAPRILYTGTISDNIDWEKRADSAFHNVMV